MTNSTGGETWWSLHKGMNALHVNTECFQSTARQVATERTVAPRLRAAEEVVKVAVDSSFTIPVMQ